MTQVQPVTIGSVKNESAVARQQHLAKTPIDQILDKLSCIELPAKEHFERYMRHKWRLNHKGSTLQGSFTSVRLFLEVYGKSGKRDSGEDGASRPRGLHRASAGPRITDLHGADETGLPYCFSAFFDGTGSHLRGPPEKTH